MNSSSISSIQSLIFEIKKGLFTNLQDVYTLASPSAYDTAWLAMIPNPTKCSQPMFKSCLDWILNNQNEEGFWGESYGECQPTIDTLPATIACMIALKAWHLGEESIRKGIAFVHSKAENILKENYHHLPRWFAIVFPAMIDLAQAASLDLVFPQGLIKTVWSCREHVEDEWVQYNPQLSYLECLPSAWDHVDQNNILLEHLSEDGSLFQSPSATAKAYMVTGNSKCMEYLKSLVQRCPNGVPAKYPMDEELIKLCMVDHVQRLGLAEHFNEEIEHILKPVYKNRNKQDLQLLPLPTNRYLLATKLHKDSLAFRLMRMQGYVMNPSCFCWFLQHADFLEYLTQNCEQFTSVLYAVYRATDVLFRGEDELVVARSFSRKLLEKSITTLNSCRDDNLAIFPGLHKVIKHELNLPWITRMDHLDHRMWIEENKISPALWIGKASFYRLFSSQNHKLIMQLAYDNYVCRQSIYAKELEELKRWSKESGLIDIGFGREKTAYCYFAVSASSCLPHDSIVRLIVTKIAALITIADDFYDVEGSITELIILTEAIQRWNGENLSGHSRIIFKAIDDLVIDVAAKYPNDEKEGTQFCNAFKDLWREIFGAWMVERTWSESGYNPSMEEYLNIGKISIGAHTIILPVSCFISQSFPMENLKPGQNGNITNLFMAVARLLNDTQSYEKEVLDGKMNMVSLHLKENPQAHIDHSIAYVKEILQEKTKEFLEVILIDHGLNEMPKSCKNFHLSCMKVFHMFFNSTNLFDSEEELLNDIKKAIYIPPTDHSRVSDLHLEPPPLPTFALQAKKEKGMISAHWDASNTNVHFLPNIGGGRVA